MSWLHPQLTPNNEDVFQRKLPLLFLDAKRAEQNNLWFFFLILFLLLSFFFSIEESPGISHYVFTT